MGRMLKWLSLGLAAVLAIVVVGTAGRPPELTSVTAPFKSLDLAGLPAAGMLQTGRGAPLAFRHYPARDATMVALTLHGAAGRSEAMHPLAQFLQAAGIAVYAPDLRGHGQSAPLGDVAFAGQIEDDLELLIAEARNRYPAANVALVGFSAGGGQAIKFGGGKKGHNADVLVLVAPALGRQAPEKARGETWARVHLARIVLLRALQAIGVSAAGGMEAIAFATPADGSMQPSGYSLRLLEDLMPDDYAASLKAVVRQTFVVLGEKDELFDAETLRQAFLTARPAASVTVVPGLGHAALALSPAGHAAILAALKGDAVEIRPDKSDSDESRIAPPGYVAVPTPPQPEPPAPHKPPRAGGPLQAPSGQVPADGAPLIPRQ